MEAPPSQRMATWPSAGSTTYSVGNALIPICLRAAACTGADRDGTAVAASRDVANRSAIMKFGCYRAGERFHKPDESVHGRGIVAESRSAVARPRGSETRGSECCLDCDAAAVAHGQ